MRSTAGADSYFQSQLAERARRDDLAAPVRVAELEKRLDYLSALHRDEVTRACVFANRAHEGQMRRTGHSYITHPLAVANILASMRMDHQCIMASVLHDVLEDTGFSKTHLVESFGREVANIVDGVSNIARIVGISEPTQAHNIHKVILASARDLRVIIVKLADRLHNMRTVGVMPIDARKRIAHETLEIYAPIAHRLGIHAIKNELEDLAFEAIYPVRADHILDAVEKVRRRNSTTVEAVHHAIQVRLNEEQIDADVRFHHKHLYSIYQKMKQDRIPFNDIMDVFAFQIITDSVDDCYRALGAVHNLYKPKLDSFSDYIAVPKANGYQSLHTAIVGPRGIPIELQVRTKSMDAMARLGIASPHVSSPASVVEFSMPENGVEIAQNWIRDILDIQNRSGDPHEFIESLKSDLFPDCVYVFTPASDVIELPRGASVIDFAYAIHTDIGNTCDTCRIDKVVEPLSTQLQSGQLVQVITSDHARPSPDWLKFSVTTKARAAIREYLDAQQESESVLLGTTLLNRSLANVGLSVREFDFRRLRRVFRHFRVRNRNELLAMVGSGQMPANVVAQSLLDEDEREHEAINIEHDGPLIVHGGEGQVITYGRCCGPVPGDEVRGYISSEHGLVVHRKGCRNISNQAAKQERVPVHWSNRTKGDFDTRILIVAENQKGVLAELAGILNDTDAGIDRIHTNDRSAQQATIIVECAVENLNHLRRITQRLKLHRAVTKVERLRG